MSDTMHPGLPLALRLVLLLLLLSPVALGLPAAMSRCGAAAMPMDDVSSPTLTEADDPRNDISALPRPVLGWAINAHHISDLPRYLEAVDAIADLGANTLIIVTPMYQKRADSSAIRYRRSKCPTSEQLIALLERGKKRGLATILMPIVLIERPKDKQWRGVIEPGDWDEWWASYETMIDRFVDVAIAADVDVLSIGSELNSTEDQIDRWRAIAEHVRDGFDGIITYSANWDRYHKVDLWPLVDLISVSSYFELERDHHGAPLDDLVSAWSAPRTELKAVARRWNRPLLISEIGYPSLPWANAHPWNYVAGRDNEPDHELQSRCWRAFFRAWTDTFTESESPVIGFCGYRWDPYHAGGDHDTGYGIVGKPAFDVVRAGIAQLRTPPKRTHGDEPSPAVR
jgi:hypothetical protein